MPGKIIKLVRKDDHYCSPPGRKARRKLRVGYGTVWECECKRRWQWTQFTFDGDYWKRI